MHTAGGATTALLAVSHVAHQRLPSRRMWKGGLSNCFAGVTGALLLQEPYCAEGSEPLLLPFSSILFNLASNLNISKAAKRAIRASWRKDKKKNPPAVNGALICNFIRKHNWGSGSSLCLPRLHCAHNFRAALLVGHLCNITEVNNEVSWPLFPMPLGRLSEWKENTGQAGLCTPAAVVSPYMKDWKVPAQRDDFNLVLNEAMNGPHFGSQGSCSEEGKGLVGLEIEKKLISVFEANICSWQTAEFFDLRLKSCWSKAHFWKIGLLCKINIFQRKKKKNSIPKYLFLTHCKKICCLMLLMQCCFGYNIKQEVWTLFTLARVAHTASCLRLYLSTQAGVENLKIARNKDNVTTNGIAVSVHKTLLYTCQASSWQCRGENRSRCLHARSSSSALSANQRDDTGMSNTAQLSRRAKPYISLHCCRKSICSRLSENITFARGAIVFPASVLCQRRSPGEEGAKRFAFLAPVSNRFAGFSFYGAAALSCRKP